MTTNDTGIVKKNEEDIEDRAQMISFRILSEVEKMCDKKGISRKELAAKLEVSPSHITQLFRGHRRVNMHFIAKTEHVFNIQFEIRAVKKPEHKIFLP